MGSVKVSQKSKLFWYKWKMITMVLKEQCEREARVRPFRKCFVKRSLAEIWRKAIHKINFYNAEIFTFEKREKKKPDRKH